MSLAQKNKLYRIIVSVCLLVVSFLLSEQGPFRLILCILAFLAAGYDVLLDAAGNIINGQIFDEKFLMSLATLGAFAVGESHEAVFVMAFFQVGELFESIAVGKSRRSIAALVELSPDYANIMCEGKLIQVSPDELIPGDVIVVKPGERIPLDGVIIEGVSSLNASALTGETLPRDVAPGDEAISGCINISGLLHIRVSKALSESTLTRILELVEQSAASKSKSENFITRFARWYTPLVVIFALLLAIVPPLFTGGWASWVHRALTFLVISCPCALVISVPLSYFGGIGRASRSGILIKGSNFLDVLAKCETIIFDKTGTLTKGNFAVKEIYADACSNAELIEMAAYGEAFSSHPIGKSIKSFYDRPIDTSRISDLEEKAGFGVCLFLDGKELSVGSTKLMLEKGIDFKRPNSPGTVVCVALDGVFMGSILVSDEIKPDSADSLSALKKQGVKRMIMLTGDGENAAEAVAFEIGLDEHRSGLLPDDKLFALEEVIQKYGTTTAYVGDGINDAPCLARADLGIAMGAMGSDAAIEAADIVLMDDRLSKIPLAVSIAKKTKRIVVQNILFALLVKFAALILGALGLASMGAAVFADVGVCVIAIVNAMRTQK